MRETGKHRRLLAVTLVLMTALITVVGLTEPARADPAGDVSSPHVTSVRSVGPDVLAVRLVVPHLLSAHPLSADAFTAEDGGINLPLTARPLGTGDVQLAVAIDTGVPVSALAIEQGVAREFLLRLPPSASVSLIDAQSGTLVGPAGPPDQVVGMLARLQPVSRQAQSADRWLLPAISAVPPPQRWKSIVYVGGAGPTSPASEAAVRQLRSIPVSVNELLLHEAPTSDLAAVTGGRLVQAGDDQELLAGADGVAADLAGTYELLVFAKAPSQLRVVVTATGIGSSELPISTPGSSRTQTTAASDQAPALSRRPMVLVTLLVGLGLVVAAGSLGRGRLRSES